MHSLYHSNVCVHIYISIYLYIYLYLSTYRYMYLYIYTHTYTLWRTRRCQASHRRRPRRVQTTKQRERLLLQLLKVCPPPLDKRLTLRQSQPRNSPSGRSPPAARTVATKCPLYYPPPPTSGGSSGRRPASLSPSRPRPESSWFYS